MGKHHRDRDRDRDMMDDPRMRDPRVGGDPRMSDPRMRDPRIMRDPRMRDPRMTDPRMGDPRGAGVSSAGGALGGAGNILRSLAGNINLAELLKGVDINQIIGLVTTLAGVNNMNVSQLGSMLRNLDLSDLNKSPMPGPGPGSGSTNNMSVDDMKTQLSTLADKLEQVGSGQNNSVQSELLKAINTLQQSPELMNMFNSFVNSNMPKPPTQE